MQVDLCFEALKSLCIHAQGCEDKNRTSANWANDKNHITQTVHKLKQNVGREVYFGLYKCNGFDHPECGSCEWISKWFGSHLGVPFCKHCQRDSLKRMLIPGVNRAGSTRWASIQKLKNLAVKVSLDWESCQTGVCVCMRSEITGRRACMRGSRATVPYMVQRSVCVSLPVSCQHHRADQPIVIR